MKMLENFSQVISFGFRMLAQKLLLSRQFVRHIMTFRQVTNFVEIKNFENFTGRYSAVGLVVLQSRPLKRSIQRQRLKLIFWRCSVAISAGTLAILIDGFRDFPQSLQENSEMVPKLDHGRFLPKPVQRIFTDHSTI